MGVYYNHGKESLWKKIIKNSEKTEKISESSEKKTSFFLPRCSLNYTNSFSFYRNDFWMLYVDWEKCTT